MTQVNVAQALDRLRSAGLTVRLDRPLPSGRFALGAHDKPTPEFVLYPGTTAQIEVSDISPDLNQAVLLVTEHARDFALLDREASAPMETRAFLVGLDERSYFMAELPRAVETVEEARRALRPGEAVEWESREENAGRTVPRQGEWLFVPLSPDESDVLRRRLARRQAVFRRNAPIPGRPGKPHTASFMAVVRPNERFDFEVYVHGSVRHADHSTLQLRGWHRAVGNMELGRRRPVALWID